MKYRYLLSLMILPVSFILVSWGVTGHRAVGKIAENHLTREAKTAVQNLLGTESMADVSTWADQIRMKKEFKYTTPWHYINLPLGLSFSEFRQRVENMTEDNVYSAVLQQEKILADKDTPKEKKVEALKYLIHFLGDLHQPMHISRAEDQGGNLIQLNYEGKGTNLHSVWDSRLIEHQGLNDGELAEKYGDVPAKQAKRWQHAPLIVWMWESYQISSKLYAEADQLKDHKIDNTYYTEHIPVIDVRLQQAGLRLAGMLNTIFTK